MPKETGGSAFPVPKCCNSPKCSCGDPGMTLRDWFAGMALQGILANPNVSCCTMGSAADAYRAADKMLAEREK